MVDVSAEIQQYNNNKNATWKLRDGHRDKDSMKKSESNDMFCTWKTPKGVMVYSWWNNTTLI